MTSQVVYCSCATHDQFISFICFNLAQGRFTAPRLARNLDARSGSACIRAADEAAAQPASRYAAAAPRGLARIASRYAAAAARGLARTDARSSRTGLNRNGRHRNRRRRRSRPRSGRDDGSGSAAVGGRRAARRGGSDAGCTRTLSVYACTAEIQPGRARIHASRCRPWYGCRQASTAQPVRSLPPPCP